MGTERLNKLIWATFVNNWHALLRDFSDRREKEAQKNDHSKNVHKNAYSPKKVLVTKKSVHIFFLEYKKMERTLNDRNKQFMAT